MERHPILDAKLSLSSDLPLYSQLGGLIRQQISAGILPVGALLPSETEICRALEVSRNTVRQAVGELEAEGLVVRMRGKGTFVVDPSANRRGISHSFTTEMTNMGKTPTSTLLEFHITIPPEDVRQKMELMDNTETYCFTRLRNADGIPLILETSYFPCYIYPRLNQEMLRGHSFYSLLYHVGITPESAEDSYEAVALTEEQARLLECEPGTGGFYFQRLTRSGDGRIYEYNRSYIRGDRMRLEIHRQKNDIQLVRAVDYLTE